MASRFRAVIFDFNGVLADDEAVHLEAFRSVAAEEGLSVTDAEYYRDYLHYNDRDLFRIFFYDRGRELDARAVQEFTRRKSKRYFELLDGRPILFDGAAGAVRAAAERCRLAIASGARQEEIRHILQSGAIEEYFSAIVAAEDVERGKPDPEPFLTALQRLEARYGPFDPRESLAIEDSPGGIRSAKAAGLRCLALEHTCARSALGEADWVIASIAEFEAWMRERSQP